jgi:hypothetical protein
MIFEGSVQLAGSGKALTVMHASRRRRIRGGYNDAPDAAYNAKKARAAASTA